MKPLSVKILSFFCGNYTRSPLSRKRMKLLCGSGHLEQKNLGSYFYSQQYKITEKGKAALKKAQTKFQDAEGLE